MDTLIGPLQMVASIKYRNDIDKSCHWGESKIDVITIKSTEFVLDSHERSSQKFWKKTMLRKVTDLHLKPP